MADDNGNKTPELEEMDVEADSAPLTPITTPVDEPPKIALAREDSILKKSVSSLPAAFGRSQSMGHSMRIKLTAESAKDWIADETEDEYYEGEYLAVRCDGEEDFWLCLVNADQKPGDKQVDIHWLERVDGFKLLFVDGTDDLVPAASVITRVSVRKETDDDGNDRYRLPKHQHNGVMKLLLDDDEDFDAETTKSKNDEVSEESDEDIVEPEEEEEEETSTTKKKGRGRPRKNTPKKSKKDDADEEEESSAKKTPKRRTAKRKSVGKVDEEESETPKKRGRKRKRADDEEVDDERPAKKPKKRRKNGPVQGEPIKSIPVIDTDPTFTDLTEEITKCCVQCATKELIRAVLTKNTALLNKLIEDKDNVFSLVIQQSSDIEETPVSLAFKSNNAEALKILFDKTTLEKPRAPYPTYVLQRQHTGSYSKYTYGHAVRSLTVGRGGKEGNNAFSTDIPDEDEDDGKKLWSEINGLNANLISLIMESPLTKETLQMILTFFTDDNAISEIAEHVYKAVQAGNRQVAIFFVELLSKRGGWGYNNLHLQALANNGEEMEKFKPVSVRKKTTGNKSITPIHMAAINPNPKYIKALLAAQGLITIEDDTSRTPIHYAAACTGSGPLDFLIAQGADYFEGDLSGVTPLMIAAKYGRVPCIESLTRGRLNQNIYRRIRDNGEIHEKLAAKINEALKKLGDEGELNSSVLDKLVQDFLNDKDAESLLAEENDSAEEEDEPMAENNNAKPVTAMVIEKDGDGEDQPEAQDEEDDGVKIKAVPVIAYIDVQDLFGRSALHYAAEFGQVDAMRLLLRRGASLEVLDKVKMTPLAVAAQQGHFECVKVLVDAGANIEARDKVRRTPLIHAVKNGSVRAASYLVHMGADPNVSDSSLNSAVHYAAAFGWKECLRYLISVGADANANNAWKTTPLAIAMMKGHLSCAEILLNQKGVDINVRNDEGDTLVIQVLRRVTPSTLAQVKFLVQDKKADINLPDKHGHSPLIIAIRTCVALPHGIEVVKILVENGANIESTDAGATSPLNVAVSVRSFDVVSYLLEKGAKLTDTATLLQQMIQNLFVKEYTWTELLKLVASKDPEFKSIHSRIANNVHELRPYLNLISNFCATYASGKNKNFNQKAAPVQNYYHNRNNRATVQMTQEQIDAQHSALLEEFFSFLETYLQLVDVDTLEQIPYSPVPAPGAAVLTIVRKNPEAGKTALHYLPNMRAPELTERLLRVIANAGPLPINILDESGYSPLTRAIEAQQPELIKKFVELGADVNLHEIGKQHNIPLHMVVSSLPYLTEFLLEKGAKVNLANLLGQTALHLAVEKQLGDVVDKLIAKGADVNAKDKRGNTPLHSAVLKRNVAIVTKLLNAKADVNAPGYKNRTVLHLAINSSSAIIDSNFELEELLLRHGASVTAVDAKKRTPLHYAFIKTGKGSMAKTDAFDPIDIVATLCSKKECDPDAIDMFLKSPLHYAAQHGATISSLYLLGQKVQLDREDDSKNTPLAIALLSGHPQYAISLIREKANVNGKARTMRRSKGGALYGFAQESSMFEIVVRNSWQGVAYLMLDAGCSYTVAMEASLKARKYQLLLSLLSKTKDNAVVQQKGTRNKTLLHFLAENSDAPVSLATLLIERGIDPDAVDADNWSALHLAAAANNLNLVEYLVRDQKVDVNRMNALGESPLFSYLAKNHGLRAHASQSNDFAVGECLVKNGAKIDFICNQTALHSAVQLKSINLINFLMTNGASIDIQDAARKTALMYAVVNNDTEIVKIIVENATKNGKKTNLNVQDNDGKTAVHLVVSPLNFGSYENVEILELLVQHGANPNIKDANNKTPMFYACLQDSGRMASTLRRLGATQPPVTPMREKSTIYGIIETGISPEMDAEEVLKTYAKDQIEKIIPQPDRIYGEIANHEVHNIDDTYYDTLITKVDVQQGAYGQNMFYKMQILHDKTKDLYVLWTRWGRVGDSGQHQKTPFPNAGEAVVEFEKIFKSKTGNAWEDRANFEKKPGKYRLLEFDNTTKNLSDILPQFTVEKYAKHPSNMQQNWQDVLKIFTDTSMYQSSMRKIGVNTDLMPLGRLSKDRLKHARKVLLDIQELLKTKAQLAASTLPDFDEVQNTLEKIVELSNVFYELIPHSDFKREAMREISDESTIRTKLDMLDNLIDFEAASKIILGSIKRSEEMHPLDYIYKAMNIVMEDVKLIGNEGQLLSKYITNTGGASIRSYNIQDIFRIQRRGEAERFQKWKELDNHFLLWHGSSPENFVGILSQGLRIAPPEAPASGYMFGKGLYFADMLEKSLGYCQGGHRGHVFLLLFEVALGNMNELYAPSHSSDLPNGKNSTKGVGNRGPDWNNQIVLPNGVRIPLGDTKAYTHPNTQRSSLGYNEYIVYDPTQIRMRYLVHLALKDMRNFS